MNLLLVADHVGSVGLVMVCWWLAHQNAGARGPLARAIAAGYGFLALAVLANMLLRHLGAAVLPVAVVASKGVLTITLVLVAVRMARMSARR